jgi:hypothetical protein
LRLRRIGAVGESTGVRIFGNTRKTGTRDVASLDMRPWIVGGIGAIATTNEGALAGLSAG